jgi:hypothetical protein
VVRGRLSVRQAYTSQMSAVTAYGRLYHLPEPLQKRIRAYFDFLWQRRRSFSKRSVMEELPDELRFEVGEQLFAKMIDQSVMLRRCSLWFRYYFAFKLGPQCIFLPDDLIFHEGDAITHVFFVRKGLVEIMSGIDTHLELVVGARGPGQHCGDMGLFDASLDDAEDLDGDAVGR